MGNLHITFSHCELWCPHASSILGSIKTRSAFTIFNFGYLKMIFPSYFLMVHALEQEVGPKGLQEHKLKYMLLLSVTNNIHGRNEGWFNWPTG